MNELVLEQILKQNSQIEKLFDRFDNPDEDIDLNCILIIKQLRTLVEHIVTYYYGTVESIEIRMDKDNLRTIVSFMKKPENNIPFLVEIHKYLQASSSHYVIDEISAPRLLNKYLPNLYKTKQWMKEKYDKDILNNINKFVSATNTDNNFYNEIINDKVNRHRVAEFKETRERYYVYKSVPIFVGVDIFFETTIGIASNFASKFNRFIVFSKFKIDDKYAVKLNIEEDFIKINNNVVPIKIATSYKISIRPCEFINFAKIVGINVNVQSNFNEYNELMDYMTKKEIGLHDIVLSSDFDYEEIRRIVHKKTEKPVIWPILNETRRVIKLCKHGHNVLKYLLVNMNNIIIKDQYSYEPNYHDLFIRSKSNPFDSYPIAMSLYKHNTTLYSLMEVFDFTGKEDQLFYRKIRNRTNEKGILYHSCEDLNVEETDADNLMNRMNIKLSWEPKYSIMKTGNFYYIKEYEDSSKFITDKLIELSEYGMPDYATYINNVLTITNYYIDSEEKKKIIIKLFESSRVACIYGPAGTGKSTLAKHISSLFPNVSKKYISNTHPAVNNMFRKIGGNRDDYLTIKSYLRDEPECDILFIDECSMVSNKDMAKVLRLSNFKYLVLLGDISQIQSIDYGTWFKIAKSILKGNCKYELTELHRTSLPELSLLWEAVRNKENIIDEILSGNGYVRELDDEKLLEYCENQIILCLNYDGLYGINNLNLILQEKNNGEKFRIGSYVYKINDPILFTENNRYSRVLYNNLKGKITGYKFESNFVKIYLKIDANINSMSIEDLEGIELIKINNDNTSDICISVDCQFDSDNDEQISKLVPFQLAYAVAIHKAQGLEYEKVKIVISENLDERVTHDIFYTAITRATKILEIYWTQNTQKIVLNNIIKKEEMKDIALFASKYGYKIREKY